MKHLLLSGFLYCTASSIAQNIDSGLVAHYRLDGNAIEATGQCNSGQVNSVEPAWDSCARPAHAMMFNGTSSFIEVPSCSALNPSSELSICAWVKPLGFNTGGCQVNAIAWKGLEEEPGHYGIGYMDTDFDCDSLGPYQQFFFQLTSGDASTSSWTAIFSLFARPSVNEWYFVVGTYDGADMMLYVNGILDGFGSHNWPPSGDAGNFFIGNGSDSSNPSYLNGLVDEVRIYNRALSDGDVMLLYSQLCSGVGLNQHLQQVSSAFVPNPATGRTTFTHDLLLGDISFEMFNVTGERMSTAELHQQNGELQLDVSSFPNGVYVYMISSGFERWSGKLMVLH